MGKEIALKMKGVTDVFEVLSELFPSSKTELTYKNPYELLIAVILSAQCTDARVNQTTPALFIRFPTPQDLAAANQSEVEGLIHSCGFYRAKAKAIISAAQSLCERFNGEVPKTLEELITLAGVGRKTASVVLNQAFEIPAIAVDTHVKRVSQRLGWTEEEDPVRIEFDLRNLLPQEQWINVNGWLILHGRRTCKARKPLCQQCEIAPYCASYKAIGGEAVSPPRPRKRHST